MYYANENKGWGHKKPQLNTTVFLSNLESMKNSHKIILFANLGIFCFSFPNLYKFISEPLYWPLHSTSGFQDYYDSKRCIVWFSVDQNCKI